MSAPPFTALGIDVGGTKIAAGVVDFPTGRIRARRVIPTEPARGSADVLNDVVRLADGLAADARSAGLNLDGLGLGLCELVDPAGHILSANCVEWQDQLVRDRLSHLGRLAIEADVRAAALAEALLGAGKPFRIFLYVTVGTGISCCLMLDGRPFLGARGATGTMASSPLSVPCETCGCVNRRTLEEIASGPALVAQFNARRPSGARRGEDVLAAAAAADAEAINVARSASQALAANVALLLNVLDPEALIVGGGLGLSGGSYWENFIDETRRHLWAEVHRELPILRAATGQDAGWIGAAAAAWRESVCAQVG